jgi:hypothetical protein
MTKPGGADAAELRKMAAAVELRKMAAAMSDSDLMWDVELAQELAQFIVTWEMEHRRKKGLHEHRQDIRLCAG